MRGTHTILALVIHPAHVSQHAVVGFLRLIANKHVLRARHCITVSSVFPASGVWMTVMITDSCKVRVQVRVRVRVRMMVRVRLKELRHCDQGQCRPQKESEHVEWVGGQQGET